MTYLIALAKKIKRILKNIIKPRAYICFSRRLERVRTAERIVAMTFDDGPFALPCSPDRFGGRALTEVILDTLREFDAKGTFDIVGYTGDNYPDTCGDNGTPAWGGVKYDHYPDFKKDNLGGARRQNELVHQILAEGHQLSNHGDRHIIFGKKPFVYGKREYLRNIGEVMRDLKGLDDFVRETFGVRMTMARPPHYVDRIRGGYTAHDAYDAMGYLYMAAGFDGAGWLPRADEQAEIDDMVGPLEKALSENPDALCGQIIFQKDGYNMARRTPVADGLRKQLEILTKYGYRVVTVEQLIAHSAFADLPHDSPLQEKCALLAKQKPIAYSDNTLRPDAKMTNGAFAMLAAPFEKTPLRRRARTARAMAYCKSKGYLSRGARSGGALKLGPSAAALFPKMPVSLKRADVLRAFQFEETES